VEIPRHADLGAALAGADLVILLQPHSCYDPASLAAARLLLDTRGVVPSAPGIEAL
jgi:UDP-N-acetyl-D-glucosamine dehydrogenase